MTFSIVSSRKPANSATGLGPCWFNFRQVCRFRLAWAEAFLGALRERFDGEIALEPRHASWFTATPEQLMTRFHIARVAADPAVLEVAAEPGGWDGLVYYRLHGSPRMYYSKYSDEYLDSLATKLAETARSASVWCIFDNTAEGAAFANGMGMLARLRLQEIGHLG